MKYNILCTSVTGIRGKTLLPKDNPHSEKEFAKGVVEDLLASNHIEEYKEPPAEMAPAAETKEAKKR